MTPRFTRTIPAAKNYRRARPGLVDQPWGTIAMTIADPFYNQIQFSQRRSATVSA
jgi:hypothetical protein